MSDNEGVPEMLARVGAQEERAEWEERPHWRHRPSLTDFLLARIDEAEADARAAFHDEHPSDAWGREPRKDDGRWSTGDHEMDECRVEGIGITIYDEGGHDAAQARHIARHDPAHVLADCEAKRRIVEIHAYKPRGATWGECAVCFDPATQVGDYDFETWPCPTLRALASAYADHPDFREEWKP